MQDHIHTTHSNKQYKQTIKHVLIAAPALKAVSRGAT
jgi:hypothetical protein